MNFTSIDDITIRAGVIAPFNEFKQGFIGIKDSYWRLLAAGLPIFLVYYVSMQFQFIGGVAMAFLTGPIHAGVALYYLTESRGRKGDGQQVMAGFKNFGTTMILGLVLAIPGLLFNVVQIVVLVSELSGLFSGGAKGYENAEIPISDLQIYLIYGFALVFLVMAGTLFYFVYFACAHFGLSAFEAMKLSFRGAIKNFFGVLVLLLLQGFSLMLSLLPCGLAFPFVYPMVGRSAANAFREVFSVEAFEANTVTEPKNAQVEDRADVETTS